ncbi:MAG TPA: hypothetical protein VH813_00945 [Candidatus Limnocylindrales bacterium]|jgi:hypothetical protein
MFRIRRFGVVKTANMVAAMYVAVILVLVIIFVPFLAIASVSINGVPQPAGVSLGGGLIGLLIGGVLIAVIYALVGWVITAIGCLLYNFVAGFVGGIEVQLEQLMPPPPPAVPDWGPASTTQMPPPAPPGS